MQEININMTGLEGYKRIDIPSNFLEQYNFVSIINITDNSVCLYPPGFTAPSAGASIVCVGYYSSMTIPVIPELKLGFNLVWTNPQGTNVDKPKRVKLIFSENNLNYNSSFAPSFSSGGSVVNTAIVVDDVGLARQTQLPAQLSTAGHLQVNIAEPLPAGSNLIGGIKVVLDDVGLAKQNQLPAQLSTAGHLQVNVAEPLPAGNNLIGKTALAGTSMTLLPSAVRTASGDTTATPIDVTMFQEANFFLDVTNTAGTSPTLDVEIHTQDPTSGKWFKLVSFTQATSVVSEMKTITQNMGSTLAVFYLIGGTTPSFTFSLGAVFK